MLKKKHSENDLFNLYRSCVLFKKYNQYHLWFGNFEEYHNIKYCRKYIQKYVFCWIYFFLLQRFSLPFVIFLCKSPYFIKYLESGFFKHLDYCFLLSFYNNAFTFDFKGKQKIKVFVKFYFQSVLKMCLEKDLSIFVIKAITEIILKTLVKRLTNRLKYIRIDVERISLNNKVLVESVAIKNNKIDVLYKIIYFNSLIKKGFCKLCFIDLNSSRRTSLQFPFYSLNNTQNSLSRFIKSGDNEILKFGLKPVKVSQSIMEKTFMEFLSKAFLNYNKDVQYLVECLKLLDGFSGPEKNISLYKSANVFFEDFSDHNKLLFKKTFNNSNFILKNFNNCFVKYKYKRTFDSKSSIDRNSKIFNEGSTFFFNDFS